MADLLYIGNSALDLVGQGNIISLDDGTPAAKKVKQHIYQAIRETLELGKWKCARKPLVLGQLTETPVSGWTYAYQLPGDYLRMVSFNDTDPCNVIEELYDINGRKLYTDETTATIVYVCDLSMNGNNIADAGAKLVQLMSVALAQKIAWSFQQSVTLKQSLEQEYAVRLRKALAQDAQETRNPLRNPLTDSTWLRDRLASTNG
jgi:hypothetical protein